MLDQEAKRKIDSARQILVGKVPDPKAQVEQITTALIYKFMDDMDQENIELGGEARFFVGEIKEYSWARLLSRELSGQERLDLYVRALSILAKAKEIPELFRTIFKDAFLPYRDPETLNLFLKEINSFTYENSENLGNAFEYLLSILGSQGDAGQFRTPRHIIDFIVEVVDPKKHERVLDPACGTAGFLISSYKHVKRLYSSNYKLEEFTPTFAETDSRDITTVEIQKNGKYSGDLLTPDDRKKLAENIVGYDISPDMVRLSLVNLYLHGFNSPQIFEYDSLTYEDRWDETFDVILANPPFMTPKGGIRPHKRFQIQANRAEVLFVDYIAEHLKINGRAGIIVPEGIVFQSSGAYKGLRKMLVDDGFLWAVVSLPSGVFNPYSGVKTCILFLDKELAKKSDEVLFVKVNNDGFDLGTQRRRIDQNDLPRAFDVIKKFEKVILGEKDFLTYGDVKGIAHTVKKDEIAESGEWNLSGERYKKEISTALSESLARIESSLVPYQELFSNFSKQAEQYQKQIKEIQSSAQPFIDYIKEQQEVINELYQNISKPIIELNKAWLGINFADVLKYTNELQSKINVNKWPMVELSELIEEKTERLKGQNIQVWSVSNARGFVNTEDYFDKKVASADTQNYKIIKPNYFAYNPSRINVGSIAFNKENTVGAVSPMYVVFEITKENLNPHYLLKLIKSQAVNKEIEQKAQGAVRKQLRFKDLVNIRIPLPPLEVQNQLVHELDNFQQVIDGSKQVIDSWKPNLTINPAWETTKIGEVCEKIQYGLSVPLNTDEKGYKTFRMNDVVGGMMVDNGEMKYADITPAEFEKYKLSKGDILFNRTNSFELVGKTGVFELEGEYVFASYLIRLIVNERIIPRYLNMIMNTDTFQTGIKQFAARAISQANINATSLSNYEIPLPPIEIQKQIVEEMEKERLSVEACKHLIKQYERKSQEKVAGVWGDL